MESASRTKRWLHLILAVCAMGAASVGQAQSYPTKPVRIIVSLAPGGAVDVMARLVAQKLTQRLGQPFVVENRAGAGGMLAAQAVAKSPADGYTLLVGANQEITITPNMHDSMPLYTASGTASPSSTMKSR